MPFKTVAQEFSASIKEVTIGVGERAVTLGGERTLPFYRFDGALKNPPRVGVEVSDLGPDLTVPGIAAFYAGAAGVSGAVARAGTMPGAAFVSLLLESADPNGADAPVDACVALCREAAAATELPLVIQGSGNVEKDRALFPKIAEALQGRNALLLSAREDNYKAVAVAAVQAYGQKIGAESSVDINLAKQLNVLISQLGIGGDAVVMNLGTAAAGYGFEYVASTLERVRLAALAQNDVMLQMPVITPLGREVWGVKEAVVSEEEYPEWGSREDRGVHMEVTTAVAALAAGSDAVILRHPAAVAQVAALAAELSA